MSSNPSDTRSAQRPSHEETTRNPLDTSKFRGALGDFPEGKLTATDEGAIQLAIGEKDGKVVIDFGTPICWIGMSPQQAARFASLVLRRAMEAAGRNGQSVDFTIYP